MFWEEIIARVSTAYVLYMSELCIDLDLSPDTLTSGWLCVMFMLSLLPLSVERSVGRSVEKGVGRSVERNVEEVLQRIMAYVGMYLIVDHYLDSPEVSAVEKEDMLRWLRDPQPSSDARRNKLLELTKELCMEKESMQALVELVIRSHRSQYAAEMTVEDYMRVCEHKGGMTVLLGARIIYGASVRVSDDDLKRLGFCIQLLDDIADCSDDARNNINTVCTQAVSTRGNIDIAAWELLYQSTLLPRCLRYHAMMIRCLALRVIDKTHHVSVEMRTALGLCKEKKESKSFRMRTEKMLRGLFT